MSGFWIRKLKVIGDAVEPAEISFVPDLNVISGPSETGKTYVLDCLGYMLGIKGPPRPLPESSAYSTVLLEIVSSKGKSYVLGRDLRKAGEVRLYPAASVDYWNIVAPWQPLKTTAGQNSISEFLLSLSELGNKVVRVNGQDKTQKLKFEDVGRFCFVDERRIAHDAPPTLPSATKSKQICDESVLRLLITGRDDSLLRQVARVKAIRSVWVAKREVYGSLISPLEQRLGWTPGSLFPSIEKRLTELTISLRDTDSMIREHTDVIEFEYASLDALVGQRQVVWDRLSHKRARVSSLDDMSLRFNVLREQYESDLSRLEFVNEGQHYMSQIGEDCCPVCGRPAHSSGLAGTESKSMSLEAVRMAALGEARKIQIHLRDLGDLMESLGRERTSLQDLIILDAKEVAQIEEQIRSVIEPRIIRRKSELQRLVHERAETARQIEEWRNLQLLRRYQESLGADPRKERELPNRTSLLKRDFMQTLAAVISRTLGAWNYAPEPSVSFDDYVVDMIIDGKARRTCGKGVRSLLYAAFAVSIMRHCAAAGLPHPGMLVLDSPISGYRERDSKPIGPEDSVPDDVATTFFADLGRADGGQVIVIENSPPKGWRADGAHHQVFTAQRGEGRYGFFPV